MCMLSSASLSEVTESMCVVNAVRQANQRQIQQRWQSAGHGMMSLNSYGSELDAVWSHPIRHMV